MKKANAHFELSGWRREDGSIEIDGVSICPGFDPDRPLYAIEEEKYDLGRVEEFVAELLEGGAAAPHVVERIFNLVRTPVFGSDAEVLARDRRRFHNLQAWERANVLFGLADAARAAVIEEAKKHVREARLLDAKEEEVKP